MTSLRKDKARGRAGSNVAGGQARATRKNKVFRCGVKHTSRIRQELQQKGLGLNDVSGASQRAMLLRVLQYLGERGFGTIEGVCCGFYRIATRVAELEEQGWLIVTHRERLIGLDGLVHEGVARYILRGRKVDVPDPQGSLDLEVPA